MQALKAAIDQRQQKASVRPAELRTVPAELGCLFVGITLEGSMACCLVLIAFQANLKCEFTD